MKAILKRYAGLLLFVFCGSIIGWLLSELGGHTFQRHVKVFYPRGTPYAALMHSIADVAFTYRPLTYFGSMIAATYYCMGRGLECRFIILLGIGSAVITTLTSAHVSAAPGPNYSTGEFNVPFGVLIATVAGCTIHAAQCVSLNDPLLKHKSIKVHSN